MAKAKAPEEQLRELADSCAKSHRRWKHIRENGYYDPNAADGASLNLVRNHIIHDYRQMRALCKAECLRLPDIVKTPLPPEMPWDYMVKEAEIRESAARILRELENDENLAFARERLEWIGDEKTRKELERLLTGPSSLQWAVDRNDLVYARVLIHNDAGYIFENIEKCAEAIRNLPDDAFEAPAPRQLSLF